jgi:hypothetical protein
MYIIQIRYVIYIYRERERERERPENVADTNDWH